MKNRRCQYCDKVLVGRTDKRFCDKGCRSNYHNGFQKIGNKIEKEVNSILRKNRGVLKFFRTRQKVNATELEAHGFRPDYYTQKILINDRVLLMVYDYGLISLNEDMKEFYVVSSNFSTHL